MFNKSFYRNFFIIVITQIIIISIAWLAYYLGYDKTQVFFKISIIGTAIILFCVILSEIRKKRKNKETLT